jgi:hypothetical protein
MKIYRLLIALRQSHREKREVPNVETTKSSLNIVFKHAVASLYCNGPLPPNERLLTDVISAVTDTGNYPITRNS